MPDLMQFKRGPSSNVDRAKLKQGEPAFLYDTKTFIIGTGEQSDPVYLINENDLIVALNELENDINENMTGHAIQIGNLEVAKNDHMKRILDLERKIVERIKSSQLSTAIDADKIGLKNLQLEVLEYIGEHGGGGSGEGGSSGPGLIPGSIGFDMLSTEVNEWLDSDYGSY